MSFFSRIFYKLCVNTTHKNRLIPIWKTIRRKIKSGDCMKNGSPPILRWLVRPPTNLRHLASHEYAPANSFCPAMRRIEWVGILTAIFATQPGLWALLRGFLRPDIRCRGPPSPSSIWPSHWTGGIHYDSQIWAIWFREWLTTRPVYIVAQHHTSTL